MSLLLRNNLLSQFTFNPAVGGMFLPSASNDAITSVSPAIAGDALAFANLNRLVRREAAHGPASPYVQVNNSVKTVLSSRNSLNSAECLFQHLGEDGYIDRTVDLHEERDLAACRYTAQTIVSRTLPGGPRHGDSSVSKSMLGKSPRKGAYGYSEHWRDHWIRMHLEGEFLKTITTRDPDYLGLPEMHSLAELAVAFSAFVYFTESFRDPKIAGDGLYLVDSQGDARRILHEGSSNFAEVYKQVDRLSDGEKVRVVSTPPDPDEPVSYENDPFLDMMFEATDILGEHKEMKVDVRITCPPDNNELALQNGLLGMSRLILGPR